MTGVPDNTDNNSNI